MGLPTRPERPTACIVTKTSLSFFWFSRNPGLEGDSPRYVPLSPVLLHPNRQSVITTLPDPLISYNILSDFATAFYGGANKQFEIQYKGNSKDYEENPCFDLPYEAVFEEGQRVLVELTSTLLANRKTAADINIERGHEPFVRYRDPPPPPLLGLGFAAEHVKVRYVPHPLPPSFNDTTTHKREYNLDCHSRLHSPSHTLMVPLLPPCRSCMLVGRWSRSNWRRSCVCTAAPCPPRPRVWQR